MEHELAADEDLHDFLGLADSKKSDDNDNIDATIDDILNSVDISINEDDKCEVATEIENSIQQASSLLDEKTSEFLDWLENDSDSNLKNRAGEGLEDMDDDDSMDELVMVDDGGVSDLGLDSSGEKIEMSDGMMTPNKDDGSDKAVESKLVDEADKVVVKEDVISHQEAGSVNVASIGTLNSVAVNSEETNDNETNPEQEEESALKREDRRVGIDEVSETKATAELKAREAEKAAKEEADAEEVKKKIGTEKDVEEEAAKEKQTEKVKAEGKEIANHITEKKTHVIPVEPTRVTLPPLTFSQLIRQNGSSLDVVRQKCKEIKYKIEDHDRPHLWTMVTTHKTLENVSESTLSDSFTTWRKDCYNNAVFEPDAPDCPFHPTTRERLVKDINVVSEEIANAVGEESSTVKDNLQSLLLYEARKSGKSDIDPLLLSVASVVVGSNIPQPASSVVLTNILTASMPLMALKTDERSTALKSLHLQFYHLACYHIPFLVLHLDRYVQGWYWQKQPSSASQKLIDETVEAMNQIDGGRWKSREDESNPYVPDDAESATKLGRNLEAQGTIPYSWFVSFFSGCSYPIKTLLPLWDLLLTVGDQSFKFFLALAILEKNSNSLLTLRGRAVKEQLDKIMALGSDQTSNSYEFVANWCERALLLWESTPRSIINQLQRTEDETVTSALMARQKVVEDIYNEKIKAENDARKEKERQELLRKSEESNLPTNIKRLRKFYQIYNPERVDGVEDVLEHYRGRIHILDKNLIEKYGESFDPVLPSDKVFKFDKKLFSLQNRFSKDEEKVESEYDHDAGVSRVTFEASVDEVLPSIFARRTAAGKDKQTYQTSDDVKFMLVDARSAERAVLQGRLPTAMSFSPEQMSDPDAIQETMEMFESVRGSIHICIFGEGVSSIPTLYEASLDIEAQQLAQDDKANTNLCALFFIKKGFPFVSTLKGGFGALHSWLIRSGATCGVKASSILVDYSNDSPWAQLELHNKTYLKTKKSGESKIMDKMKIELYERRIDTAVLKIVKGEAYHTASSIPVPSKPSFLSKLTTDNMSKANAKVDTTSAKQSSEALPVDDTSFAPLNIATDQVERNDNVFDKSSPSNIASKMKMSFGDFNLSNKMSLARSKLDSIASEVTEKTSNKTEIPEKAAPSKTTPSSIFGKKFTFSRKDENSKTMSSSSKMSSMFSKSSSTFGKTSSWSMKFSTTSKKATEATAPPARSESIPSPSHTSISTNDIAVDDVDPTAFGIGNLSDDEE